MERPGELLTIKAFAEAAGRSQQAIYKQIGTRLASYVHEKDGQKYIERRALEEVFKIGDAQPIQPLKTVKSLEENNVEQRLYGTLQATIELLQEQIRVKDLQIEAKDKQIAAQQDQLTQLTAALEHTTTSLQASQALHAGTMQQLGSPEPEISCAHGEFAVPVSAAEPVQESPSERRRWRWPWSKQKVT